ncbi:PREDICTED: BTB/POZ domain-containing protein FBL11 isoform X1 [Prunus mume]|uniref:BTB/POZ domain-containing protein FBL11 isoform X1 n=1 Tax=Prunus mume TaxID=102107 RepID=A0ABM0PLC0_PRUMU|nr:PREDICTED: BTB/POZ domain-containing protein FBL11 isoform X1 [Prunus mume]
MASSTSDDDFITVVCSNPNPIQANTTSTDIEILISVTNIPSWDLPSILCHQTVKVQAHRNRLIEHSSYFNGLLSGSFSESGLDCIAVEWNLEEFLHILNCIYDCPLDVTSNNFLPLYEGALYFGVEMLLMRCKTWFSEVVSTEVPPQVQLDDLISIWSFGLEHARDFLPELCGSYLARNFMWAISMNCFVDIPYDLLLSCVKHMNLTVDSEMHLSNALLVWIDANTECMKGLSRNEDVCTGVLKQIRLSLLPLWFAAEKRSSCHFSKFADESIDSIFRLLRIPSTGSVDALGASHLHDLRIRLTKFSKRVNLSRCSQITSAVLLLSLLPSANSIDYILRGIGQSPFNLERLDRDQCSEVLNLLPTLSFEAVQEVDISKCPRLHLQSAIECFRKSFPSLRILKAAFLLKFKISTLRKLVRKCPMVCEVDLTTDTSPIISSQVSIVSSSPAITPQISNLSLNVRDMTSFYNSGLSIAKLTLEGRNDLYDSDLQYISRFCVSLQYVNLKGCTSLTDVGIASLLRRCIKLHSVLVCDTSFGINSVLALCSSSSNHIAVEQIENELLDSLALNLQILHMGSCKCVDETSLLKLMSQMQKLKSLCLSDTHLSDGALYSFRGSSLEVLDISNTVVSNAAVAYLVGGNPGLKCLKARGCRNLSEQESDPQKREFSFSYSCRELHNEIGRTCMLEEIALGWGFSYASLEALKPAITSLRKITVGLGGLLGEDGLRKLPTICPMLESIILYFQVISDRTIMNIMANLKKLVVLAFCHCLGDISILSFKFPMPNLRKLKLERVTPWMNNNDLFILTQSCANLVELSLLGCTLLDSESQQIISQGWPGLVSIHLEECGRVTTMGVSSLLDCKALEDLLLRHNGPGLQRSFIFDAASKLPMLRKVSLDFCDAAEGDFDIPNYGDRHFLSTLKIAKCKLQKGLKVSFVKAPRRRQVHKETLVLVWNSSTVTRTVVKERL